MLISLALTIAERQKTAAAAGTSVRKAGGLAPAIPAALAVAALSASVAASLGMNVNLPDGVKAAGLAVRTQAAELWAQIDAALHGKKAVSDEHPAALAAPAKPKKIRLTAFDSIRFFLIAYIACGHFISFAGPSKFAFRAITQINVVVGAFFALSGYVSAYTTTEVQEHRASDKFLKTPSPKWIMQKLFGYYPLHLLVLVLFSPMFLYSDVHFSGWPTAIFDGILELTLSQAWFPMHAEVWNAPTWFLSALSYSTVVLRFALPYMAQQSKHQLRHTFFFLWLFGLVPKLGYCDDHEAWGLLEGAMAAKKMPNIAIFNTQRFNPLYASIEVMMGAVACRLVMLDGAKGEEEAPKTNTLSTLLPLLAMIDVILLRAKGRLHLSDVLTRAVIFIPLFLRFLMALHRQSMKPEANDLVVKALNTDLLVTLGNLSFPIFVVHGPLGQLFYKKLIATKLFGGPLHQQIGPNFFYVYLATCVGAAWVLQKTFLQSKKVDEISKGTVERISAHL